MNHYDRARSAINQLEQQQVEIQRRFEEEQQKLADLLQRKQAELEEKQQQVMARLEREQQRLQDRMRDVPTDEGSGRDRILDQATELFTARGYLDVSMREIAEAAGLRKATIYHHFRDKDELFIAVVLRSMRQLRIEMADFADDQTTPLPQLLESIALMQLNQWSPGLTRIAHDFQEHIPETKHEEIHQELFASMDIYRAVFQRAIDRGDVIGMNAPMAAAAFFHLVSAWIWDPFGHLTDHLPEPPVLAKLAVDTLLYGIAGPGLRPANATTEVQPTE